MFIFIISSALLATAFGQGYQGDPRTAAIIAEQRYQGGDGRFGAQYSQEDGVNYKEESSADGTRSGSYSYVDPNGQRHTISFTAGKHGFTATGDGIPQPLPTTLPVAPQPQYTPLPQYNSPQEPRAQPQYQQPQSQYQQPQPQYQQPQPQYQPQPAQYRPQPDQYETTPQPPHRFYPPGKLSLNRSPDGYSYTFNKSK